MYGLIMNVVRMKFLNDLMMDGQMICGKFISGGSLLDGGPLLSEPKNRLTTAAAKLLLRVCFLFEVMSGTLE